MSTNRRSARRRLAVTLLGGAGAVPLTATGATGVVRYVLWAVTGQRRRRLPVSPPAVPVLATTAPRRIAGMHA